MGLGKELRKTGKSLVSRMKGRAVIKDIALPLDRSLMSPVIRRTLSNGTYEGAEVQIVSRLIKQGDVVVELGGGLGFVSALAARQVGSTGQVISYEGNPKLIDYIETLHRRNDCLVEVRNAIVTPDQPDGSIDFYLRRDFWASSLDGCDGAYEEKVSVPLASWQSIKKEAKPNVLIIDIEGGEINLVPQLDLSGIRALMIEIHFRAQKPKELTAMMQSILDQGFYLNFGLSHGDVLTFSRDDT